MPKTCRIRILSYLDPAPILQAHDSQIDKAIWICHDRDINNETGELKALHYHINIRLNSSRVVDEIARWFADDDNQSSGHQDTGTLGSAIDYYKHTNYPDKYQYTDDDIQYYKCTSADCVNPTKDDDVSYAIIVDMLDHKPLIDLVRKYGWRFVNHYSQYRLLVSDMLGQQFSVQCLKEQFAPASPPDGAIEVSSERFNKLFSD